MDYPVEEMEFKSLNPGKITTSQTYCKNHNVSRREHARKALQIENYKKISEWFDSQKTIMDNLKYAKETNKKISRMTLENYCRTMNIPIKKKRLTISQWYDSTKSVSENYHYAKFSGVEIKKDSLYRYCKRNHIPTQGTGISGC